MSRSRYHFDDAGPHFCTCTIVGWLPVFTRVESMDIVLDAWRFAQAERNFSLFAYVILENHVHFIASAPDLSDVIQRFKSYTARQIVELLQHRSATTLLRQLRTEKRADKRESEFQVWQEGSHPQRIENDEMMWQKIEYIHSNPQERGFVDDPTHWRYSSARNYARQPGLIDVITDWK